MENGVSVYVYCVYVPFVEWATFKNTIILFVCSPKFCISIVFIFSWDRCKSQETLETMLMQNFGGQTKSIMVFLKVHGLLCRS